MSVSLSHALIQLCLSVDETGVNKLSDNIKDVFVNASEQAWQESALTLYCHRLSPMVGYALLHSTLKEFVPPPQLQWFIGAYQDTLTANTVRLLTLDGILQKLAIAEITPVLWKGVVLADYFYPDVGMRMMGDVDLAIAPDELPTLIKSLASLGFTEKPEKATVDAIYLENAMGVLCDIHHRVRLFEGKAGVSLNCKIHPRHLKSTDITVLEPNAMLVHLIVHQRGHRSETGPVLLWMLDLAFVIKRWGDRLDPTRIQSLLPEQASWVALLKTLRFLEVEWGAMIPQAFTPLLQNTQPFTLSHVLRQRRLAQWGLPRLRGWFKLGVAPFMGDRYKQLPQPYLSDLLLWPIDLLQEL